MDQDDWDSDPKGRKEPKGIEVITGNTFLKKKVEQQMTSDQENG